MHFLPLVVATAGAAALAPMLLAGLIERGRVRPNYRDQALAYPFGVLIVAAAVVALVVLAPAQEFAGNVFYPQAAIVALYALGVALLGLIDDTLAGPPRGLRAHAGALLSGGFSTGALKAVGSLGLALAVMSGRGLSTWRYLLAAALLVLATHAFNLLDVRPGRTLKALLLLGAGLTIATMDVRPLWTLGLFAGPAIVAGLYDLRERAMLGDIGASTLGAIAGLWLVLSLSGTAQAVAAALLLGLAIYGELRSISALVERNPLLRVLDSLGRP